VSRLSAGIVQTLCEGIAKYCPRAWVAIISNPVNSTVPIAAEVFKRAGGFQGSGWHCSQGSLGSPGALSLQHKSALP
jgi:lactate/malate dehydrogenase, NAD binding domain